jgi:hypothetical protein
VAHAPRVDEAFYQGSEETDFSGPNKDNGTRNFYTHIEQNLVDLICDVSYGALNIYWYLTIRI